MGAGNSTVDEPEWQELPSGVRFQVLSEGKGRPVTTNDVLRVKYEGTLVKSGKRFDKGTMNFALGRGKVIRGWDEGIAGMQVAEKRKLYVPASLAYGNTGAPPE